VVQLTLDNLILKRALEGNYKNFAQRQTSDCSTLQEKSYADHKTTPKQISK
jgi:hypothetical protein